MSPTVQEIKKLYCDTNFSLNFCNRRHQESLEQADHIVKTLNLNFIEIRISNNSDSIKSFYKDELFEETKEFCESLNFKNIMQI